MRIDTGAKTRQSLITQQTEGRITSLRFLEGSEFRVLGRVDRFNPAGVLCSRYELGCAAGTTTVVLPHTQFTPSQREAQHGDLVKVWGELCEVSGRCLIRPKDFVRNGVDHISSPVALLPREWVLPAFYPALKSVTSAWLAIGNETLKAFLGDAFKDTGLTMGMLNAPASQRYRHAYQGGGCLSILQICWIGLAKCL